MRAGRARRVPAHPQWRCPGRPSAARRTCRPAGAGGRWAADPAERARPPAAPPSAAPACAGRSPAWPGSCCAPRLRFGAARAWCAADARDGAAGTSEGRAALELVLALRASMRHLLWRTMTRLLIANMQGHCNGVILGISVRCCAAPLACQATRRPARAKRARRRTWCSPAPHAPPRAGRRPPRRRTPAGARRRPTRRRGAPTTRARRPRPARARRRRLSAACGAAVRLAAPGAPLGPPEAWGASGMPAAPARYAHSTVMFSCSGVVRLLHSCDDAHALSPPPSQPCRPSSSAPHSCCRWTHRPLSCAWWATW